MRRGAGPGYRKVEMVLSIHSARRTRLGCRRDSGTGRRNLPGPAAQVTRRGQPKWLLLRPGPDEWEVPAGIAFCQIVNLVHRTGRRRTSHAHSGERAWDVRLRPVLWTRLTI